MMDIKGSTSKMEAETYFQTHQTSTMNFFAKIDNG